MTSIQERVAKGAAWLDKIKPGWRDAISLDALDLSSMERCVLGQAFADDLAGQPDGFARGCYLRSATHHPHDCQAMGFNSSEHKDVPGGIFRENRELVAEWRRVIHQSRVPAETQEPSHVR